MDSDEEDRCIIEEKVRRKIIKRKRINTIQKLNKVPQRRYILTSRFNNETYAESRTYCEKRKPSNVFTASRAKYPLTFVVILFCSYWK